MTSTFATRGNVELLSQKKLAVFTSKNTPKTLYPFAERIFSILCRQELALAGGWQSPLEKRLFRQIPPSPRTHCIHYLAKDINSVYLTKEQNYLLEENRLLVIAPHTKQQRISRQTIEQRDSLIFSQIKNILFLYIRTDGRLNRYFVQLLQMQYNLFVLDHPLNDSYLLDDIVALGEDNAPQIFNY
ncbi:MAG: hypothetical protein GF313_10530 [Caldithrix sp.]|nr:hypothetical protein [Caldithrix sp.]